MNKLVLNTPRRYATRSRRGQRALGPVIWSLGLTILLLSIATPSKAAYLSSIYQALTKLGGIFADEPAPSGAPGPLSLADIQRLAEETGRREGVPPKLILAVIHHSSNFDPNARSTDGAIGLMQVVPTTGAEVGVTDVKQPAGNVQAGARYLQRLLTKYDGDLRRALVAYRAGLKSADSGAVRPATREFVNQVLKEIQA